MIVLTLEIYYYPGAPRSLPCRNSGPYTPLGLRDFASKFPQSFWNGRQSGKVAQNKSTYQNERKINEANPIDIAFVGEQIAIAYFLFVRSL